MEQFWRETMETLFDLVLSTFVYSFVFKKYGSHLWLASIMLVIFGFQHRTTGMFKMFANQEDYMELVNMT